MEENSTVENKGLGAVHLPWSWTIPVLLLALRRLAVSFHGLSSVKVPRAPYQLCPSQNTSLPLPSFPLP